MRALVLSSILALSTSCSAIKEACIYNILVLGDNPSEIDGFRPSHHGCEYQPMEQPGINFRGDPILEKQCMPNFGGWYFDLGSSRCVKISPTYCSDVDAPFSTYEECVGECISGKH